MKANMEMNELKKFMVPNGIFYGGEQRDKETLPKGTFRGGEQRDKETLPKGTFRGGEQRDKETLPKGTFRGGEQRNKETLPKGTFRSIVSRESSPGTCSFMERSCLQERPLERQKTMLPKHNDNNDDLPYNLNLRLKIYRDKIEMM